ncbi:MAG TPA: acyloxyacyl hydrolase [Sulfuriferula sp.]|nr:acyloxyacyl hydrolase [Sulfuriferula sp.]
MKPNLTKLAGVLLLLCAALPAHAVDSVSLELGTGDNTDMGRVGLQWDWNKKLPVGAAWMLSGYWDASLGYWQGDSSVSGARDIYDIGFTPVFRLSQNKPTGWYAEAAVGVHLLSRTQINDRRRFGTAFQFGDHIGMGYKFGERGEYDLGYRLQHLSNADIKKPNDGINFNQIRFSYHF